MFSYMIILNWMKTVTNNYGCAYIGPSNLDVLSFIFLNLKQFAMHDNNCAALEKSDNDANPKIIKYF